MVWRWFPLAAVAAMSLPWAAAAEKPAARGKGVLARALAGPLKDVEEIVFAVRLPYDDPHWYANIGYYCDDENRKAYAGNGRPDVGQLCKLNLRNGQVTSVFDGRGGSIRDPQVHYDGRRILFAYRRADRDDYDLYEIHADGTGLRQITSDPWDDYEPCYLPDGDILFVSTRCRCWVNCWMTQVGVLYRCDPQGTNVQRLSYSGEHDNTPWVLPDGRILYTRWEYVDRSQVEFHHLWAMNPDGSGQTIFYGNMHPGIVMIDAKPIPGTDLVLASFSPGHGASDHKGIATIVSPAAGPDHLPSARGLHKGPLVKDPYPLSEDCFLVARGNQILVMDSQGNFEVLYARSGEGEIHEPRPIAARRREPLIQPRVNGRSAAGRFVLADIYQSRNLDGVARGEVKKLLILEILPKQVNFSGGPDLVSWLGTFTLERVLGTVPVEPDGSAYFEVPAGRPVFFVALDDKDLSVKRMHSFTTVMPGEVAGCVGCHEPRTRTPDRLPRADLQALRKPPSQITPFAGFPDVLDFPRDVQPILDRHCVACHTHERREGDVILAGDLGPHWSHSFFTLFAHRLVADGRNGLGNHPPRTIGSSASRLLKLLDGSHYGAWVSLRDWRTVWLWIESGAPYAGSYAGLRNEEDQKRAGSAVGRVFFGARDVLARRCGSCHALGQADSEDRRPLPFPADTRRNRRGLDRRTAVHERIVFENDPLARYSANILLNFTRPEWSPLLLGPLARSAGGYERCGAVFQDKSDPDYQRLLAAIARGKADLDASPRYATPGFKPNRQYVREMKRYGILPASFDLSKDPIDVFQVDQAYWKSLWYQPPGGGDASRRDPTSPRS